MTDDQSEMTSQRRTFLKTVGLLGAAATVGSATTGSVAADEHLDEYYRTLRSDLTGRGGNKTLPAGEFVFGTEDAALEAFSLSGAADETSIEIENETVPITKGEQITVETSADVPAETTYGTTITDHALSDGDLLLGVAYLRSDDDDAELKARFGYDDDSNQILRSVHHELTGEWRRYFFPVEVSTGSGDPTFEFHLGYGAQTVDFGGLALIDYGTETGAGTLPPYDYAGRAEDAEWREAAWDRIEEHRKTDFEVEVLDTDGNAVESAQVDVSMAEHDFDFGTAVSVEHINGDSEDDERYRQEIRKNFNKAVIENGLKYPQFLGPWQEGKEDVHAALDWLNEQEIPTRGHYLLWEEYSTDGGGGMAIQNPGEMSADEISETISQRITDHATDVGDKVIDWDMHNHPVWQSNFRDDEELGWDAVDQWWGAAEEATDLPLYTNEMGQVGGTWQQDGYLSFLDHLVENDYPLDGIGFMAHHQQWWDQMMDMSRLKGVYDLYDERYDVPVLITEFDIQIFSRRNAQDVSVQTDYTRDFLLMTFSHPVVEGILSWGFWEDDHWRPTGAYYDSDWTLRPNGEAYFDLVFDEWWTEKSGSTDADGVYATDGFKGTYQITVSNGEKDGQATVAIDDDTDTVTVTLDALSGGEGPPQDLDGDGRYEDVDGDGDTDINDVRTLLNNRNSEMVQSNADAYDFDGDGSVDVGDVLELFRKVYR